MTRRHPGRRGAWWVVLPLGLLVALWQLPALWHLPVGISAWVILRWCAPDLASTLGRPRYWAVLLAVFVLLGGLLGPADTTLAGIACSTQGGAAATTMIARAWGLLMLGSVLASAFPLRAWIDRSDNRFVRRVAGVVLVAANFVPSLLQSISEARLALRERRPGARYALLRLELLAVHTCVRAARLAEEVAFDMTLAAHNGSETASHGEERP